MSTPYRELRPSVCLGNTEVHEHQPAHNNDNQTYEHRNKPLLALRTVHTTAIYSTRRWVCTAYGSMCAASVRIPGKKSRRKVRSTVSNGSSSAPAAVGRSRSPKRCNCAACLNEKLLVAATTLLLDLLSRDRIVRAMSSCSA